MYWICFYENDCFLWWSSNVWRCLQILIFFVDVYIIVKGLLSTLSNANCLHCLLCKCYRKDYTFHFTGIWPITSLFVTAFASISHVDLLLLSSASKITKFHSATCCEHPSCSPVNFVLLNFHLKWENVVCCQVKVLWGSKSEALKLRHWNQGTKTRRYQRF